MNRIDIRPNLLLACLAAALSVLGRGIAEDGKNFSERDRQKAAAISRGKTLFVNATCWGCHPHGENSLNGDRPLKGPAFEKKYKSDQSIVEFVRKGSPDAGMPPFPREKLSDNDLKSLIVYIRSLSVSNAK